MCRQAEAVWCLFISTHLDGATEIFLCNICDFSLCSKNHGERIKGYHTIFLGHSLVWKELCFGSGRDWFSWNSTLPKSIKLTVAGLVSGEKYPGAMLLDFLWFFKWELLQIWEFTEGFYCIQVSKP